VSTGISLYYFTRKISKSLCALLGTVPYPPFALSLSKGGASQLSTNGFGCGLNGRAG